MKIFQILDGICYYDATAVHPTLDSTVGKYPPDVIFVEAPDYVFENWGYDETKVGYERFIQPTPPEGWKYNTETGGFELINPPEPEVNTNPITELQTQNKQLEAKVKALTESSQMLEDCIVEMAEIVYA